MAGARQRRRPLVLTAHTLSPGALSYLIATTIESGPARCSTKASRNPAFFIHDLQSAPV